MRYSWKPVQRDNMLTMRCCTSWRGCKESCRNTRIGPLDWSLRLARRTCFGMKHQQVIISSASLPSTCQHSSSLSSQHLGNEQCAHDSHSIQGFTAESDVTLPGSSSLTISQMSSQPSHLSCKKDLCTINIYESQEKDIEDSQRVLASVTPRQVTISTSDDFGKVSLQTPDNKYISKRHEDLTFETLECQSGSSLKSLTVAQPASASTIIEEHHDTLDLEQKLLVHANGMHGTCPSDGTKDLHNRLQALSLNHDGGTLSSRCQNSRGVGRMKENWNDVRKAKDADAFLDFNTTDISRINTGKKRKKHFDDGGNMFGGMTTKSKLKQNRDFERDYDRGRERKEENCRDIQKSRQRKNTDCFWRQIGEIDCGRKMETSYVSKWKSVPKRCQVSERESKSVSTGDVCKRTKGSSTLSSRDKARWSTTLDTTNKVMRSSTLSREQGNECSNFSRDKTKESSTLSSKDKAKESSTSSSKDKVKESSTSSSKDKAKESSTASSKDKAKESSTSSSKDKAKESSTSSSMDKAKESSTSSSMDKAKESSTSSSKDKAKESSTSSNKDKAKESSTSSNKDKVKESSTSSSKDKAKESSTSSNKDKVKESSTSSSKDKAKEISTSSSKDKAKESSTASSKDKAKESSTSSSKDKAKESSTASSKDKAKESSTSISKDKIKESSTSSSKDKAKESSTSSSKDKAKESSTASSKDKAKESSTSISKDKIKESSTSSSKDKAKESSTSSSKGKAKERSTSSSKDKAKESSTSSSKDKAKESSTSSSKDKAKESSTSSSKGKAKVSSTSSSKNKAKESSTSSSKDKAKESSNLSSSGEATSGTTLYNRGKATEILNLHFRNKIGETVALDVEHMIAESLTLSAGGFAEEGPTLGSRGTAEEDPMMCAGGSVEKDPKSGTGGTTEEWPTLGTWGTSEEGSTQGTGGTADEGLMQCAGDTVGEGPTQCAMGMAEEGPPQGAGGTAGEGPTQCAGGTVEESPMSGAGKKADEIPMWGTGQMPEEGPTQCAGGIVERPTQGSGGSAEGGPMLGAVEKADEIPMWGTGKTPEEGPTQCAGGFAEEGPTQGSGGMAEEGPMSGAGEKADGIPMWGTGQKPEEGPTQCAGGIVEERPTQGSGGSAEGGPMLGAVEKADEIPMWGTGKTPEEGPTQCAGGFAEEGPTQGSGGMAEEGPMSGAGEKADGIPMWGTGQKPEEGPTQCAGGIVEERPTQGSGGSAEGGPMLGAVEKADEIPMWGTGKTPEEGPTQCAGGFAEEGATQGSGGMAEEGPMSGAGEKADGIPMWGTGQKPEEGPTQCTGGIAEEGPTQGSGGMAEGGPMSGAAEKADEIPMWGTGQTPEEGPTQCAGGIAEEGPTQGSRGMAEEGPMSGAGEKADEIPMWGTGQKPEEGPTQCTGGIAEEGPMQGSRGMAEEGPMSGAGEKADEIPMWGTGQTPEEGLTQCARGIVEEGLTQCAGEFAEEDPTQCARDIAEEGLTQCATGIAEEGLTQCTRGIAEEGLTQCTGATVEKGPTQCAGDMVEEGPTQCTGDTAEEGPTQCAVGTAEEGPTQCAMGTAEEGPTQGAVGTAEEGPTQCAGGIVEEDPMQCAGGIVEEGPTQRAGDVAEEGPTQGARGMVEEDPTSGAVENAEDIPMSSARETADVGPTLGARSTAEEGPTFVGVGPMLGTWDNAEEIQLSGAGETLKEGLMSGASETCWEMAEEGMMSGAGETAEEGLTSGAGGTVKEDLISGLMGMAKESTMLDDMGKTTESRIQNAASIQQFEAPPQQVDKGTVTNIYRLGHHKEHLDVHQHEVSEVITNIYPKMSSLINVDPQNMLQLSWEKHNTDGLKGDTISGNVLTCLKATVECTAQASRCKDYARLFVEIGSGSTNETQQMQADEGKPHVSVVGMNSDTCVVESQNKNNEGEHDKQNYSIAGSAGQFVTCHIEKQPTTVNSNDSCTQGSLLANPQTDELYTIKAKSEQDEGCIIVGNDKQATMDIEDGGEGDNCNWKIGITPIGVGGGVASGKGHSAMAEEVLTSREKAVALKDDISPCNDVANKLQDEPFFEAEPSHCLQSITSTIELNSPHEAESATVGRRNIGRLDENKVVEVDRNNPKMDFMTSLSLTVSPLKQQEKHPSTILALSAKHQGLVPSGVGRKCGGQELRKTTTGNCGSEITAGLEHEERILFEKSEFHDNGKKVDNNNLSNTPSCELPSASGNVQNVSNTHCQNDIFERNETSDIEEGELVSDSEEEVSMFGQTKSIVNAFSSQRKNRKGASSKQYTWLVNHPCTRKEKQSLDHCRIHRETSSKNYTKRKHLLSCQNSKHLQRNASLWSAPVEAPRRSGMVDAPRRSAPVKVPRRSAPVEAPHRSAPVEEPRRSMPVEVPRRSMPVEVPHRSMPVEAPRRSAPVEAPRRSAQVEAPRRSTPVKAPRRSAPVEALRRSVPVEAPRRSTPVKAPRRSAPVEEPRRSAPVEEPRRSAPVEEPRRSAPVEESRRSAPVEEPRRSAPVEDPRRSAPVEDPRRSAPVEEPRRSAPVEEPRRSAPVEEVRRSAPVEEPRRSAPVEEPRRSAPVEESRRSVPVDAPWKSAPVMAKRRVVLQSVQDEAPWRLASHSLEPFTCFDVIDNDGDGSPVKSQINDYQVQNKDYVSKKQYDVNDDHQQEAGGFSTTVMSALRAARNVVQRTYSKLHKQFECERFWAILHLASREFPTKLEIIDWQSHKALQCRILALIKQTVGNLRKSKCVEKVLQDKPCDMKVLLFKILDNELESMFNIVQNLLFSVSPSGHADKQIQEQRTSQLCMSLVNDESAEGPLPQQTCIDNGACDRSKKEITVLPPESVIQNNLANEPNDVLRIRCDKGFGDLSTYRIPKLRKKELPEMSCQNAYGPPAKKRNKSPLEKTKRNSEVALSKLNVSTNEKWKQKALLPKGPEMQFKPMIGSSEQHGNNLAPTVVTTVDYTVDIDSCDSLLAQRLWDTGDIEIDGCPATPGKSMFGPTSSEIQNIPASVESVSFSICPEQVIGEAFKALVRATESNQQAIKPVPAHPFGITGCEGSVSKIQGSARSFLRSEQGRLPIISTILQADLELSHSLLSPLKDSLLFEPSHDGKCNNTTSAGITRVLPEACFNENAQFELDTITEDMSSIKVAMKVNEVEIPAGTDKRTEVIVQNGLTINNTTQSQDTEMMRKSTKEPSGPVDLQQVTLDNQQGFAFRRSKERLMDHCGSVDFLIVENETENDSVSAANVIVTSECGSSLSLTRPKGATLRTMEQFTGNDQLSDCRILRNHVDCLQNKSSSLHSSLTSPITGKEESNFTSCPATVEATVVQTRSQNTSTTVHSRKRSASVADHECSGVQSCSLCMKMAPNLCKIPKGIPQFLSHQDMHQHKTLGSSDGEENATSSKFLPANNVVIENGERLVKWTREEDRLVLFECRRLGTSLRAFTTMASRLQGKNAVQVLTRYQELLRLFHLVKGEPGPACQYNSTSSEDGLSV
uniref:uncharacterized protein isoform X2 n=1 Tax=Myxine glutinosa TaxID=7769 RepID=UPI00358E1D56